ncbi:MAG TPA: M48 family metalloprotease [Pyrinomonadaceae bacterium]|nr:M48 family metalloprotease [Pyrinomonadaceae bacterium]
MGLFLIPSYVGYEPYSTSEVVSTKLAVLAIVSAGGVAFALWRGFRSWFATRSLLREWLAMAAEIRLEGISTPTFRIRHPFPIIAVVGTIRPRLFVAEHVLQTLSEEEMKAAIAHECGHLAARDNLKRSLLRACRDAMMIVPCGRSIDRAWAENAEAAADEHAADRGSAVALNLASALIEIARMVTAGAKPSMPAGAFILGDEAHGVMGRVNRLLVLAGAGRQLSRPIFVSWAERIGVFLLLTGLILTLTNTHALASLHIAMERVVQALT